MEDTNSNVEMSNTLKGLYGDFIITSNDKKEVIFYRLSILICGLFFSIGIVQWLLYGSEQIWIFLIGISISLGLSLKWIHIYIRTLHQVLIFLWAFGCIGFGILSYYFGFKNIIFNINENPSLIFFIGPLFASLAGIGFKEFFCFRRIEAIGITIFIPIALIGYLTELANESFTFSMLVVSSLLLLILGIRKFNLPAEADIGDKSVFDFLESQRKLKESDS